MNIFYYHQETKEFLSESEARLDPAEAVRGVERYLVPANATAVEPPVIGENQAAVWDGTAWAIASDFRRQTVYRKRDAQPETITELGAIGEDFTLLEPCDYPTWDETSGTWVEDTDKRDEARVAEIMAELQALDLSAVRPLRAIAAGTSRTEDTTKITELETQALALRAELATLT